MRFWAPILPLAALLGTSILHRHKVAPPQPSVWDIYTYSLSRSCPDKRLDYLTSGDFMAIADHFSDRLPADHQRSIKSSIFENCRSANAGHACDAYGFLQGTAKTAEMEHFVQTICTMPHACTAPGVCHATR